jgi:pyrroline-5-carboxylate reductase
MVDSLNILMVGCGKMGGAMHSGWLANNSVSEVVIVSPSGKPRDGATVFTSVEAVPADFKPDVVLLAVKPQKMAEVVPLYKKYIGTSVFVTVAAGKTLSFYEELLGEGAKVIRTMPNTPSMIGQGTNVSVANGLVTEGEKQSCDALMQAIGQHYWLDDEDLMDAVTAISGCGPAYLFHYVESFIEAGKRIGLPEELAKNLAIGTVVGSGNYLDQSDESASQLRINVTSPNGVTAAGLATLMDNSELQNLLCDAALSARNRSIALK